MAIPIRSSFCTVFGPIPGIKPGESKANRRSASSRERTTRPAGLPSSLVIFASSRLSEMPTEQVRPVCSRIWAEIRRIVAFGAIDVVEFEIGLVEPDHLDRLDVAPQHFHHPRRGLAVGGEVGLEEDRVRQPPPRRRRRHRRVDPGQPPRLVARRRHHRPRPRAADDDRLALQLRLLAQLDRGVEGVHVEVGDDPWPVLDFRHPPTVLARPAGRTYVRPSGNPKSRQRGRAEATASATA